MLKGSLAARELATRSARCNRPHDLAGGSANKEILALADLLASP
jgi:hypothetical protein